MRTQGKKGRREGHQKAGRQTFLHPPSAITHTNTQQAAYRCRHPYTWRDFAETICLCEIWKSYSNIHPLIFEASASSPRCLKLLTWMQLQLHYASLRPKGSWAAWVSALTVVLGPLTSTKSCTGSVSALLAQQLYLLCFQIRKRMTNSLFFLSKSLITLS